MKIYSGVKKLLCSLVTVATFSLTSVAAIAATNDEWKQIPEAVVSHNQQLAKVRPDLKCLVDTPALDEFTSPGCVAISRDHPTATAVFQVFNLHDREILIDWSDSRCQVNSIICSVPIEGNSNVPMTVTVTDKLTGRSLSDDATAVYIYEPF
jgi:hypothetical protein